MTDEEDTEMADTLYNSTGTSGIIDIDPKKAPEYFDSLKEYQFWGYGVGHVYNDLAAGMWISYGLYFFVKVINLEKGFAG